MNKDLIPPCGLYCGACGVYIATQENDEKIKEEFSRAYGVSVSEVRCRGCMSDNPDDIFIYDRICPIKTCVKDRKIEGCFQCADFPCSFVDNFPVEEGKRIILRSIPMWKKLGTEKWVEQEIVRFQCSSCGTPFYRLSKYCRKCKSPVHSE
jgi:hypothetical protein